MSIPDNLTLHVKRIAIIFTFCLVETSSALEQFLTRLTKCEFSFPNLFGPDVNIEVRVKCNIICFQIVPINSSIVLSLIMDRKHVELLKKIKL